MKTRTLLLAFLGVLIASYLFLRLTCQTEQLNPHYVLEMYDTQIKVIDPTTGKVIYVEPYETNSRIVNALLEDNK